MSLHSSTRSIERAAGQKLLKAWYSNLNWSLETRAIILFELSMQEWGGYLTAVNVPTGASTVQLDLYSTRIFGSLERGRSGETEKPASLVFSMHPNGSVCVLAYSFASSHSGLPMKCFTLALYPHTNELAGVLGRRRLRRHIQEFEKLAYSSLTEFLPTRSTGRFISRLEARTHKFRSIYENISEKRRAEVAQNVAIGGGLAAGLLSSTVFPTILAVGDGARSKVDEIVARCGEGPSADNCLSESNYQVFKLAADVIVPEIVLIVALILAAFSLLAVIRYVRN
jgi:hypothetical protein